MTGRERIIRVLNHEEIDRYPRTLWHLPNVRMFCGEKLAEFHARFPADIGGASLRWGESRYTKGVSQAYGAYTDEFGCTFELAEPGVNGEIKRPIFADWRALDSYRMPTEILENADFSQINEHAKRSEQFVLVGTHIRPFERMQFMRGTEDLLMDLALGEPYAERLAKQLHEFSLRELEKLVNTDIDAISFMDDWGTQQSLLISPQLWRQFFKPMYREYCDLAKSKGKYIFFHSDGNIELIYRDLVEIGIHAINSQLFCMDLEGLVEKYGDKICFYGEIDRQRILPFGTVTEVHAAVDRVAAAVEQKNKKRTGAIAQCEWNAIDPYENIVAVFEQWNRK